MPLLAFFWHRSCFVGGRNFFRQAVTALEPLPSSPERDLVLAMAQSNLAIFLMGLGNLDESTQLAMSAQMLYETHQLPPPLGMDSDPRLTLANNARLLGDCETAVSHATATLTHNQQHNHLRNVQEAYRMIAEAQIGQHALAEAWHNAEQSFALAQEGNDLCGLAYAHETLGGIAFAQQKDKLASHHYEASYKTWRQLGHLVGQADEPASPVPATQQPLVDPLTNRKLEVLQLIADGLTNQQIADKLIIAKGTVKYYTNHIYSKLQVSSRTQAAAHDRKLGILP